MDILFAREKSDESYYDLVCDYKDFDKLDEIVCDGEATKITINLCLELCGNIEDVLSRVIKKVNKPNGKLAVVGLEPLAICEGFSQGELSLNDFNYIIRGVQNLSCLSNTKDILQKNGLIIMRAFYSGYTYILEAKYGYNN